MTSTFLDSPTLGFFDILYLIKIPSNIVAKNDITNIVNA